MPVKRRIEAFPRRSSVLPFPLPLQQVCFQIAAIRFPAAYESLSGAGSAWIKTTVPHNRTERGKEMDRNEMLSKMTTEQKACAEKIEALLADEKNRERILAIQNADDAIAFFE